MKITINRLFDVAKTTATETGKEITEFVEYTATALEQLIRAMRNGLTFADNFNCKISTVDLTHNVEQVINTDGKSPIGIEAMRTISATTATQGLIWYLNQKGETVVNAQFVGSPSGSQKVVLRILF